MKHFILVLSVSMFVFYLFPLHAQEKYVIEWNDSLDFGGVYGGNVPGEIAVDPGGNVYITGDFWVDTLHQYFFTLKYSSNGNIVWIDSLQWSNNINLYSTGIDLDGNGNVYFSGYTWGRDTGYGIVGKQDSLGNLLWLDTLSIGQMYWINGLDVDNIGNAYVTGPLWEPGSSPEIYTAKINSSGNLKWQDTLRISLYTFSNAIALDGHGYFYVTGYFIDDSTGLSVWANVKYDTSGNVLHIDTLQIGQFGTGYGVAVDSSGYVYFTGTANFGGGVNPYVTVKYDSLWNIAWVETIGPDGNPEDIAVDWRSNVFLTGHSDYNSVNHQHTIRYDSSGNVIWQDSIMSKPSWGYGIAVDNKGNIYTTGRLGGSRWYAYTIKYARYKDAGILSIVSPDTVFTDSSYTPEIWVKNNSFEETLNVDFTSTIDSAGYHIYMDWKHVSNLLVGDSVLVSFSPWTASSSPQDLVLNFNMVNSDHNPANDDISKYLYVRYPTGISEGNRGLMLNVSSINKGVISFSYNTPNAGSYEVNLYAIDGRMIKKIEGKGKGYHTQKIKNLPSGIYFIRLKQGNNTINKRVLVIK